MKTEQLLFWLAVCGNLILFFYTVKVGFRATRLVRKGDRFGALWNAMAAGALAGLTVLLPWTLLSGDGLIGKLALLICILTPFVVSGVKLMACVSGRSARARILIAVVATVGMVVVFVVSGNWAWFWIGTFLSVALWIVARKRGQRMPVTADADWDNLRRLRSREELNDWMSNPAYSHLSCNAHHRDT